MTAKNANTDLPLLGFFDLPLYRFYNDLLLGSEGCALFVFAYFLVDNFADDNFGFDRKLAINRQKIELCTPLGTKYVRFALF
jgi:hypothetical protein